MKRRTFWFAITCWAFGAAMLMECDPFHQDLAPAPIINASARDYYVLPNKATVIDLKVIVNSAYTDLVLKVSRNPEHGKLTQLSSFLLKYEPARNFTSGDDKIEISFTREGKVVKTEVIFLHMQKNIASFPCGVYAVADSASTYTDSPLSISILNNDRICGPQMENFEVSIHDRPAGIQAELQGDSVIVFHPADGFIGKVELIYELSSRVGENTISSFGVVRISVVACALPNQIYYTLDLTDDKEDPLITGRDFLPDSYEVPLRDVFASYCTPVSSAIYGMGDLKATNHSGVFSIHGSSLGYIPDLNVIPKNDTASIQLCVNGRCSMFNAIVIRESDHYWITQWVRSPVNTVFFVDENTGFVGSDFGLLKTTDGGENWNFLDDATRHARDIHFLNAQLGFVAVDGGLIKTTDGGDTWKFIPLKSFMTSVRFLDPTTGFVGATVDTDGGDAEILKTTDGGETWKRVFGQIESRGGVTDIRFANSTTGYAYVWWFILRTEDSGESWLHTFALPDGLTHPITSLAVTGSDVYAAMTNPSGPTRLWRSGDGALWSMAGPSPVSLIAFSPSGNLGVAYGWGDGGGYIFISHDNGASWERSERRDYVTAISVPSDKVAYLVGLNGDLLKYTYLSE